VDIPFPGFNCGKDDRRRHERQSEQRRRLGRHDPSEAVLECFTVALRSLTSDEIALLRAKILEKSDESNDFVLIIDGHTALRSLLRSD
jgi:hypothetical protein